MAGRRISDDYIRSLGPKPEYHALGENLYVRVKQGPRGTSRGFVYRPRIDGRIRSQALGRWDPSAEMGITYRAARARVAELNAKRDREEFSGITVDRLVTDFIESDFHRRKSLETLEFYTKVIREELGGRLVGAVSTRDVTSLLTTYRQAVRERRPHCDGRTAVNRLRSIVRQVFQFAAERGDIPVSPASGISQRTAGGLERVRDRVLSDDEIRELWADDSRSARFCRFQLLTGPRISSLTRATWKQIEGNRWRFMLDKQANLAGREHWVHLPRLALDLLGNPGPPESPLFTSRRGHCFGRGAVGIWAQRFNARHGRDMTWNSWKQLDDAQRREDRLRVAWVSHDLRRTLNTRISEFGRGWDDIAMKVIGDKLGGVKRHYNHSEMEAERIEAAERWAAQVEEMLR